MVVKVLGIWILNLGAILGDKPQFDDAIPELDRFFRLSGLFSRQSGPISGLGMARDLVRKVLLTEDGRINPQISVNTVDEIVKLVNESGTPRVERPDWSQQAYWPDHREVRLAFTR